MSTSNQHREIVQRLLDTKAVDFTAIGKAIGELGPTLATSTIGEDGFCGTMRYFVRLYRPGPVVGGPVEELGALAAHTEGL